MFTLTYHTLSRTLGRGYQTAAMNSRSGCRPAIRRSFWTLPRTASLSCRPSLRKLIRPCETRRPPERSRGHQKKSRCYGRGLPTKCTYGLMAIWSGARTAPWARMHTSRLQWIAAGQTNGAPNVVA